MGGTACRPANGWKNSEKSDFGAIIPFRSNLFYQKLLKITRPTPWLRAPQAGQAMPAKFLLFFRGARNFSFKKSFCWHCFCVDAQAEPFPPNPAFGGKQAGKNSFPPHPLFFLPACTNARFAGGRWTLFGFWRRRGYYQKNSTLNLKLYIIE